MKNNEYYIDLLKMHNMANIDDAIVFLKENGANQMQSVAAIMNIFALSLKEADKHVLYSDHWKENLEFNIELRNIFFSEG